MLTLDGQTYPVVQLDDGIRAWYMHIMTKWLLARRDPLAAFLKRLGPVDDKVAASAVGAFIAAGRDLQWTEYELLCAQNSLSMVRKLAKAMVPLLPSRAITPKNKRSVLEQLSLSMTDPMLLQIREIVRQRRATTSTLNTSPSCDGAISS
jgi:hypothetical protein